MKARHCTLFHSTHIREISHTTQCFVIRMLIIIFCVTINHYSPGDASQEVILVDWREGLKWSRLAVHLNHYPSLHLKILPDDSEGRGGKKQGSKKENARENPKNFGEKMEKKSLHKYRMQRVQNTVKKPGNLSWHAVLQQHATRHHLTHLAF